MSSLSLSLYISFSLDAITSHRRRAITELVNKDALPAKSPLDMAQMAEAAQDRALWEELASNGVVEMTNESVRLTQPGLASLIPVASLSGGECFMSLSSADLGSSSLMELLLQLEARQ